MAAAHAESPFEEPHGGYSAAAFEVESPEGMHVVPAPLAAELPVELLPATELPPPDVAPAADESDIFAPASESPAGATREGPIPAASATAEEDITNTLTMADLYAKQGLVAEARQIYENILQRDPGNALVRRKLGELAVPERTASQDNRVAKLEGWLARVGKREAGSV